MLEERRTVEVYSPAVVRDLRIALRTSWQMLNQSDHPLVSTTQSDHGKAVLARRLLKCAASGETNPSRLVLYALGPYV